MPRTRRRLCVCSKKRELRQISWGFVVLILSHIFNVGPLSSVRTENCLFVRSMPIGMLWHGCTAVGNEGSELLVVLLRCSQRYERAR